MSKILVVDREEVNKYLENNPLSVLYLGKILNFLLERCNKVVIKIDKSYEWSNMGYEALILEIRVDSLSQKLHSAETGALIRQSYREISNLLEECHAYNMKFPAYFKILYEE